jgi:hypothetical protein
MLEAGPLRGRKAIATYVQQPCGKVSFAISNQPDDCPEQARATVFPRGPDKLILLAKENGIAIGNSSRPFAGRDGGIANSKRIGCPVSLEFQQLDELEPPRPHESLDIRK